MTMEYRFLFIGNSATYVHDLPATLVRLCEEKGIAIHQKQIVYGGRMLEQHAADKGVLEEIAKGYDGVFLQENGNGMTSPEARESSRNAIRILSEAVRASGAKLYFYVRPPYGIHLAELDSLAQCELFDSHFTPAAEEEGALCVYVNRAFAEAIRSLPYYLWGPDHAHINPHGAYLAVCTFYATLFGRSAAELGIAYDLPAEEAEALQKIADRVAGI